MKGWHTCAICHVEKSDDYLLQEAVVLIPAGKRSGGQNTYRLKELRHRYVCAKGCADQSELFAGDEYERENR